MKEICEEAMDQVTTTGVIKLEGAKNWNVWKFQVGVILRSLDLLDIVEGKIVKPEAGQENLKNNCRFRIGKDQAKNSNAFFVTALVIGKDQAKNSNAFFVTALVANEQIYHKWFLDSGQVNI
ncbi:hypothetical protein QE152_g17907 [Popillia japonica]|uniref:Uncharacterized protein n=1 Tax=Popillia japonica TaxID=7064 RepID=A0AAW1L4X5_POPJA